MPAVSPPQREVLRTEAVASTRRPLVGAGLLTAAVAAIVAVAGCILSQADDTTNFGDFSMAVLRLGAVPWHTGKRWAAVLALYDERIAEDFSHCRHELVPTRFGKTQVHVCGPDGAPAVFLFHGARATATSWAGVVRLFKEGEAGKGGRHARKLHVVDYICDPGRSIPNDIGGCPSTAVDHADWIEDMYRGLSQPVDKADFVGYSLGSFVSAVVANERPALVRSRIVLIAPAAVFTPLAFGFWVRVLANAFPPTHWLGFDMRWFWQWMTAPGFNAHTQISEKDWEFILTVDAASYSHSLAMMPYKFSDAELKALAGHAGVKKTLLYPVHETVTDAAEAPRRAKDAGIDVVLAADAGHGLLVERPEWFASTVVGLLQAD